MRVSGSRQQTLGDLRGSISLGGFTDLGRGNPPVVALAVGRQEGRHGGKNPTRGRWFQGEMHPVDPVLTGDRRAETLLTSSPPE